MNKPLKILPDRWMWYVRKPGDEGVTYDGDKEIAEHYLEPSVFASLTGSEGCPMMGTRAYTSEREAMDALQRAQR